MRPLVYDCSIASQRAEGLADARKAIEAKEAVVIPTDTVYGIAADAFSPVAVAGLLAAKGRGRSMPPPVLISNAGALDGLASDVPQGARDLAERFWPGALTLILFAQPSLTWDLGDTQGTVALRMPNDRLALDLLAQTGPLAVSSANRTGEPTGNTAAEAVKQLGEEVHIFLSDGERPHKDLEPLPSTIVDATQEPMRVVRQGAISLDSLRDVVPTVLGFGEESEVAEPTSQNELPTDPEATPASQEQE